MTMKAASGEVEDRKESDRDQGDDAGHLDPARHADRSIIEMLWSRF